MATTLKDAENDASFLEALNKLSTFATKADLEIKADAANVYTKTNVDTAFVKIADLKTKAAEKEVVNAIIASHDFTDKVYTKATAEDTFVKIDGTNATDIGVKAMLGELADKVILTSEFPKAVEKEVEKPTVAVKILDAKDGQKSVLVTELGKALDNVNVVYDGNKTAKVFLGEKGLQGPTGPQGPSGQELSTDKLKDDENFQKSIAAKMSEVNFEIPESESTPLSWDW